MTTCNCGRCYCTESGGSGRKAALCLYCSMGEHSSALREPNRFRTCRVCHHETLGLDEWPVQCASQECGAPFGPVTLGWDRVAKRERESPMTSAADLAKAMTAHRKAAKKGAHKPPAAL